MTKTFADRNSQNNTMVLTGDGKITTLPNTAILRLGVQTTGENLVTTQSDNAQISQIILQSLMQLGVSDIKTYQYLIEKNYVYEDNTRIDKGYTVQNILEINLTDLSQIGKVIDTAVNSGANVVDFISFQVSDPDFYYQQALNLAVMNAIQKAESITKLLGLDTELIPTKIVENSTTRIPSPLNYNLREIATVTPIQPGTYQITAQVTAEFDY